MNSMINRRKVAVLAAEFMGTYVLATAVLSMASRTTFPFFPAAAAGIAVAAMVLLIGTVSGAHINPAVTLSFWTQRKITALRAGAFIAAQMLGGLAALKTNEYLIDQALPKIAGTDWDWRVLLAETIGTFVLAFGVAAALAYKYEGGKLAAAIGASVFLGVIAASFGANGALNPAVALGINSWSASYALGPVVGAVLGMNFYTLLFATSSPARKKK